MIEEKKKFQAWSTKIIIIIIKEKEKKNTSAINYKTLKKKKSMKKLFTTTQMLKSFFHALYLSIPKITLFKILSKREVWEITLTNFLLLKFFLS